MVRGAPSHMSIIETRRTFVISSGAAGLKALGAQGREVRTAFIGVGNRGGSLLNQVLKKDGAPVTAICDLDPNKRDKAAGLAARFNPKVTAQWREIVDMKNVDAVYIATPCNLHADMAEACLKAGKYVYLEKPMGIHPEEVDRVVKAERGSRVFLQIGQQMRYWPWLQGAVPHVHSGIIGKVLIIKAQRHSPAQPPGTKERLPEWYFDAKISGDRIVENGVHNLDVCNWIANSLPVAAFGHGQVYLPTPEPPGLHYMDGYSVMYQYGNQVNLTFSEAHLHPRNLTELAGGQWYAVFGEKGTIMIKRGSALLYEMQATGAPRELLTPDQQGMNEDAVGDFYAAIREGRRPFADSRVGATAALTTLMGRKAIYERRCATWKEMGVSLA